MKPRNIFFASITEFPQPTNLIFFTFSDSIKKVKLFGKGEPSVLYSYQMVIVFYSMTILEENLMFERINVEIDISIPQLPHQIKS